MSCMNVMYQAAVDISRHDLGVSGVLVTTIIHNNLAFVELPSLRDTQFQLKSVI